MPQKTRILLVLLVALAAVAPWYHSDHHDEADCSVCTLVAHGAPSELPVPLLLGSLSDSFEGRCPEHTPSLLAGAHDAASCRGPPAPL